MYGPLSTGRSTEGKCCCFPCKVAPFTGGCALTTVVLAMLLVCFADNSLESILLLRACCLSDVSLPSKLVLHL